MTSLASNSPVHVPLVQKEPLFGFWQVNVHIFVDASHNEHLVIVAHWLGAEKFFWLFQRAIHSLNLAHFRVQREAVANPTVVASENQDF